VIGGKMIRAGIIGATGYTGQELVRLLHNHHDVELSILTSKTYADKQLSETYGNLRGFNEDVCKDMTITEAASYCDVLFLALPHGLASHQVTSTLLEGCRIIDLGADFRLKDQSVYESWYHTDHGSPHLLDEAVYGLCEWYEQEIASARLVANPGCYTTASILTLAPLLKDDLIDPAGVIIDAKSGVTGAGRKAATATLFSEVNESVKAYAVTTHRHTPEIEQQLSDLGNHEVILNFTPHLIPMSRGILATTYSTLRESVTSKDIRECYQSYYQDKRFIRILPEQQFPETKWVKGSNLCDIGFTVDQRTRRLIAVGAIDNLLKGASGQAVQNMNIMFSLPEHTGLDLVPGFPM
jgi:N-acetyl-gamma-glutamyl-phosphate reductase